MAFAKVWCGKARLPSIDRMWKEYPGAGNEFFYFPGLTQCKYLPFGRPNGQADDHSLPFPHIASHRKTLHHLAEQ